MAILNWMFYKQNVYTCHLEIYALLGVTSLSLSLSLSLPLSPPLSLSLSIHPTPCSSHVRTHSLHSLADTILLITNTVYSPSNAYMHPNTANYRDPHMNTGALPSIMAVNMCLCLIALCSNNGRVFQKVVEDVWMDFLHICNSICRYGVGRYVCCNCRGCNCVPSVYY